MKTERELQNEIDFLNLYIKYLEMSIYGYVTGLGETIDGAIARVSEIKEAAQKTFEECYGNETNCP